MDMEKKLNQILLDISKVTVDMTKVSLDISEVKDDMSELKVIQVENTTVLNEHARRSTASEVRIGLVEKLSEKTWVALQKHFGLLKGVAIALSGVITVLGVLWTGVNIYLKLNGVK